MVYNKIMNSMIYKFYDYSVFAKIIFDNKKCITVGTVGVKYYAIDGVVGILH